MNEIEWIEVVEGEVKLLRMEAKHSAWTPKDALKNVIEIRGISQLLMEWISGRTPGWCPVLDAWIRVVDLANLSVERLADSLQDPNRSNQNRSVNSVMTLARRVDTATRRHRKRLGVETLDRMACARD